MWFLALKNNAEKFNRRSDARSGYHRVPETLPGWSHFGILRIFLRRGYSV